MCCIEMHRVDVSEARNIRLITADKFNLDRIVTCVLSRHGSLVFVTTAIIGGVSMISDMLTEQPN